MMTVCAVLQRVARSGRLGQLGGTLESSMLAAAKQSAGDFLPRRPIAFSVAATPKRGSYCSFGIARESDLRFTRAVAIDAMGVDSPIL